MKRIPRRTVSAPKNDQKLYDSVHAIIQSLEAAAEGNAAATHDYDEEEEGRGGENEYSAIDAAPDESDPVPLVIDTTQIRTLLSGGELLEQSYTYVGPVLSFKWSGQVPNCIHGPGHKKSSVVTIPKQTKGSVELLVAVLFQFTCDCEERGVTPGGVIFINSDQLPPPLTPRLMQRSDNALLRYILRRNIVIFERGRKHDGSR